MEKTQKAKLKRKAGHLKKLTIQLRIMIQKTTEQAKNKQLIPMKMAIG
jgi:hypothetical protein